MSTSLIDMELLEKLQLHYCKANDVYLSCLDRERNELTACYRSIEERDFFNQFISHEIGRRMLANAEMSQVEAIIEEELAVPYIKFCAVINRINDSIALIWLVTAVIEEKIRPEDEVPSYVLRTSEGQFYRSVAFLETLSKQIFKMKQHELNAKEAMEQAIEAEGKYKAQMVRSEAMARVVHLIEEEDEFALVCENAVQEVCKTLQIQGGCILQTTAGGVSVETVCDYSSQKDWNLGDRLQGIAKENLPFFDGKPYMLSSDSMMREDLERFFKKYHLKAGMFQPVEVNGQVDTYLCFYEFEGNRIWDVEDIKFINDVKRVLQGIMERRIVKNTLAGSYASLESILENVGCAIYVVDYDNEEVLYMNQKFHELIARDMDKNGLQQYFFSTKNVQREFPPMEVHLSRNNIWLDMNQVELTWVDGRKVSLGTIYDITDKKLYQLEMERQISNDNLTGLYNRMRCEKDLATYIKDAEETGKEGAFLCIDIDDFQNINDGLGHQYGDTLLKAIAHNLRRISGIEENCYRMSGDEFAVIVKGDNYRELSRICKDLREV
ncbi:MAG: GGDEF domain-containing protein, partial [Agathobacter sp.]|nr:GGDEF domain-containing protein [Agathobacter sp.]